MRFANDTILNLAAVVATTASEALDLDTIVNCSVQIKWTSTTASFTVGLEVSNDGVNYTSIDSATVADNNGSDIFVIQDNPYRYARIYVTRTSGTLTTLTAVYHGKGF